jgi:hypothetical protein
LEPNVGLVVIGGERSRFNNSYELYKDCFTISLKELGSLKDFEIWIELAKYTPIFQRPYRYKDMEIFDLIINLRVVGSWLNRFFCMRVCFNYHDA